MRISKSDSVSYYILMALIFFQGVSGLYGGGALIIDPGGELLELPISILERSPFDTYMIPGLILFTILGIYPFIVLFGLWQQKIWSWPAAVVLGIALIVWIGVEIMMVGYYPTPPLQLVYGLLGLILLIITQFPSVKRIRY